MFDHAPNPVRDAAIRARIEKCRRIQSFIRSFPYRKQLAFVGSMLTMTLFVFSEFYGSLLIIFGVLCMAAIQSLRIVAFIQFTLRELFLAIVIPQAAYVTFISPDPTIQLIGCALIAFTITAATLYVSRVHADMQRFHDELHGPS